MSNKPVKNSGLRGIKTRYLPNETNMENPQDTSRPTPRVRVCLLFKLILEALEYKSYLN